MIHEEICTYEVAKLAKGKEGDMEKFEYKIYGCDDRDLKNETLNEFGREGWKLVSHNAVTLLEDEYRYTIWHYFFFCKPLVTTEESCHAEIEKPKKERAELQAETECYALGVADDYNICDQFNYECDQLWQLITMVCLNANPPIRVREHTLKSLKEAGVHCKLKVEGRTSKLELWRGDELVGVIINTKPKRVEIGVG